MFLSFPAILHVTFCVQYGRNALEIVMKSIVKLDCPLVSPPSDFKGDFFKGTIQTSVLMDSNLPVDVLFLKQLFVLQRFRAG